MENVRQDRYGTGFCAGFDRNLKIHLYTRRLGFKIPVMERHVMSRCSTTEPTLIYWSSLYLSIYSFIINNGVPDRHPWRQEDLDHPIIPHIILTSTWFGTQYSLSSFWPLLYHRRTCDSIATVGPCHQEVLSDPWMVVSQTGIVYPSP